MHMYFKKLLLAKLGGFLEQETTKSAHPTYEKYPSDLRKMPIRPTNVSKRQLKVGRMQQYAVFNVPIRPTVHWTYYSC